MTNSTLPPVSASRFYKRWTQADAGRTELVDELANVHARLALTPAIFAELLQKDTESGIEAPAAMRRLRNLVMAVLIQRDLTGRADLAEVVETMSALADFAVQTLLAGLTRELVALHGTPVGEESGAVQEMIVIGMGKLGGRELNTSSDIDLIFLYGEEGMTRVDQDGQRQLSNHEFFTRLGKRLIGALSEITAEGYVFRVDMALRPNGASGPLVASLAMLEEYFVVQGREWERYAWVKAHAMSGTADDLAQLESLVRPFVYRRYLDFGSIDAIRNMHAQIRAEVVRQEKRYPDRSNNVKLGRGGIREIEFLAQVFQLIRGGRDAALRDRSTRAILDTLAQKQLLDAEAVRGLQDAYTFLRNLEHRLQYVEDAQTHALPPGEPERRHIAAMMGYEDVNAFMQELERQRRFVAEQFDAIFRDKSAARGNEAGEDEDGAQVSDSSGIDAIAARLQELNYPDAEGAARRVHQSLQSPRLQALPEASMTRLLALINKALPVIAAKADAPAATLGRLLDFFEAVARRAAYLALLTEYPHTLERVIKMMSASDWAAKYLAQHPILLDELLDERTLHAEPDWDDFARECNAQLAAAAGDVERQMDVLRELHHAQMLCLLAQDLEGDLSVERLADHLSKLADILIAATVQAAWETIANRHRAVPLFSVIAYGKLGGKELGYVSDL
ncbi:MAG TPA: bifunctional [glutamate--ammonia ligase]-adenylyl-L-tyrosine phosphorylase/[glutamate--ammonia-ligase] adenylyltransferase, partial [Burkholderiaceae bacterium]